MVLRLTAVARNERRAVERKIPLPLSVGAKPDQERNGINGGDPELVEGRRPFMPDSTLNRLRSDAPRVEGLSPSPPVVTFFSSLDFPG